MASLVPLFCCLYGYDIVKIMCHTNVVNVISRDGVVTFKSNSLLINYYM